MRPAAPVAVGARWASDEPANKPTSVLVLVIVEVSKLLQRAPVFAGRYRLSAAAREQVSVS